MPLLHNAGEQVAGTRFPGGFPYARDMPSHPLGQFCCAVWAQNLTHHFPTSGSDEARGQLMSPVLHTVCYAMFLIVVLKMICKDMPGCTTGECWFKTSREALRISTFSGTSEFQPVPRQWQQRVGAWPHIENITLNVSWVQSFIQNQVLVAMKILETSASW